MNNGKITGHLVDTLHYKDGTEKVIDHGYNTITNGLHQLLAQLIGGLSTSAQGATFVDITSASGLYFVVGSKPTTGSSSRAISADDTVANSFASADQIMAKAVTDVTIDSTTKNKIVVACNFTEQEATGEWQTCGIVKGGTLSGTPTKISGGVLLNRKEATLSKNTSFSVTRTFEFIF